jgi:hypothetical protein
MVIFEDVILKIFKLLIAERTSVMSVNSLLNTAFAVDVAATCNIAVVNGVQTDGTLKLNFQFIWADFEVASLKEVMFLYLFLNNHC